MRKLMNILYSAALAMLIAGCENTIDTIEVSSEDVIMMNALMNVNDDVHIVYLSHGQSDDFHPYTTEGELKCYVNDTLAATATPKSYYDLYFCKAYTFKADFKAGDKVKLTIDEGLSAEVTVPECPEILSVDTTFFENTEYIHSSIYSLRTRLEDVLDDENYYSFNVNTEIYRGSVLQDTLKYRNVTLYTDNEPLLKEYSSGDDNDNKTFFDDYVKNKYHLFTDKTFTDGSYVLNVGIYPYDCLWGYFYDGTDYGQGYVRSGASAIVQVSSLSPEAYRYIKAAESADFWHLEPVIFPQNVSGGLGFVSVANSALWKIRFPDRMVLNDIYGL
jgi:hypothetical protein